MIDSIRFAATSTATLLTNLFLVLEEFDETRWIAALIARAPKPSS